MKHQLLSDIIFQNKQLHHQRRLSQKSSSDMYSKNIHSDKSKNLCLLGSLELKHKPLSSETPFTHKFQIVQLKKNKQKQFKQKKPIPNHFQSQLKTRQIQSYRNSFKIKKLEQSQIGLLQNIYSAKYTQNSDFLIDKQFIRQPKKGAIPGNFNNHKVTLTNRSSSLNIQTLPSKFIPSQVFQSQKSQDNFSCRNEKFSNSEREFQKKNLYLDFHPLVFSLSDVKSFQSPKKTNSTTQIEELLLRNPIQFRNLNTGERSRKIQQNCFNQQQKTYIQSSKINESPRKNRIKRIYDQEKQHQERLQIEKKIYLQIRKQVNKNYGKPFNPPQNISAQSYIVYQTTKKSFKHRKLIQINNEKRKFINGHKVLVEFNSRTPCQIASLTKIMTLFVALQISQKYFINPNQQQIKIGSFQQKISGTSANIKSGETYTLEQLFYGLMLPSGNDASIAIAVWGGQILIKNQKNKPQLTEQSLLKKKKLYYERFLEEMNKKAGQLGLQKTHFANSHGLINAQNKSCAFDLALLSENAMKNLKFKSIVQTRRYQCTIKTEKQDFSTIESPSYSRQQQLNNQGSQNQEQIDNDYTSEPQILESQEKQKPIEIEKKQKQKEEEKNLQFLKKSNYQKSELFQKKVNWQNTHMLLHQKPHLYKGIKTGITNAAGPCLASFVEYNQRQFIIIVLNCKTMKQRFRDTQNLRKWTFQKEQIKLQQHQ